jgi:hypothetical protein
MPPTALSFLDEGGSSASAPTPDNQAARSIARSCCRRSRRRGHMSPDCPRPPRRAPPRLMPPPMFGGRPMGGLGVPPKDQELQGNAGSSARCRTGGPHSRGRRRRIGTVFGVLGPKIQGSPRRDLQGFVAGLRRPGCRNRLCRIGRLWRASWPVCRGQRFSADAVPHGQRGRDRLHLRQVEAKSIVCRSSSSTRGRAAR